MTRPGPRPHRTGFVQCPSCNAAELVGRRGRLVCAAGCGHDEPIAARVGDRPPTEPEPEGLDVVVGTALAKARAATARARIAAGASGRVRPSKTTTKET